MTQSKVKVTVTKSWVILSVSLCSSLCILTVAVMTVCITTEGVLRWTSALTDFTGALVGVFDHPPVTAGLLIHLRALQHRCAIQPVCVCTDKSLWGLEIDRYIGLPILQHFTIIGRGGKSTKIFYSSKSTITLLKFYLRTSKSTSLKIYSSKSKK